MSSNSGKLVGMTTPSDNNNHLETVRSTGTLIVSGFERSPNILSAALLRADNVSEVDLQKSGTQIIVNVKLFRSKTTIHDLIDLAELVPGYTPRLQGTQGTPVPTVMISLLPPDRGGRSFLSGFKRTKASTKVEYGPRTRPENVTRTHEIESSEETVSSVESKLAVPLVRRNSITTGKLQTQTTRSLVAVANEVTDKFESFTKGVRRRTRFASKVLLRITRIISAAIFVLINSIFGSDYDDGPKKS